MGFVMNEYHPRMKRLDPLAGGDGTQP
jgi:hypothetical protein